MGSLDITFESNFDSQYRRTNKATNKKSLRCFPECSPNGHSEFHFCGSGVNVTVHGSFAANSADIVVWGAVMPDIDCSFKQCQNLVLDQPVPLSYFTEETDLSRHGPWISGNLILSYPLKYHFNPGTWNYPWLSNRKVQDLKHHFAVVVGIQTSKNMIYPLLFGYSRKFTIFSRGVTSQNDWVPSTTISNAVPSQTKAEPFGDKRSKPKLAQLLVRKASSTSPTTPETWKNRTLDRIYLAALDQFGSLRTDDPSVLKFLAREMGSERISEDEVAKLLERLFGVINVLPYVASDMLGSACQNQVLGAVSEESFYAQYIAELRDQSFIWTKEREDETYENGHSLENTVYSSFRNCVRYVVQLSLEFKSETVETFQTLLNAASKLGLLLLDPFHPPSQQFGLSLQEWIYGTPIHESKYSAGCDCFCSQEDLEEYGRDLLTFRRFVVRGIMHVRVNRAFPVSTSQFSASQLEHMLTSLRPFDGEWFDQTHLSDMDVEPSRHGFFRAMAGTFSERVLRRAMSSIRIDAHQQKFTVLFKPSLFLPSNRYDFILDGNKYDYLRTLQLFSGYFPSFLKTGQCTSFIAENGPTGTTVITASTPFSTAPERATQILPEFCAKYPCDSFEVTVCMRWHVKPESPDVLKASVSIYLLPNETSRELELNQETVLHLFTHARHFLIDEYDITYIRVVEHTESMEGLL